jgi:ADP-ribose pyrophosphatase YjhB (NUDIX family)
VSGPEIEIVARAVAVDSRGRVLLTQRAGRDYWVPPGGHAHTGESLPQAARREAEEEAGVAVEVGPLLYAWEAFQAGRHRVEVAFLGRLPDGLVAERTRDLGPAGGERLRRLVPLDELPALRVFPAALATPGLRTALARAAGAAPAGDAYLGVEGATHLVLPHRLNVRVVIVQNGRVLLVSDDREAYWVLPGGHVESEESLDAAAVRETLEETGLRLALERLLYVREFVDDNLQEHAVECYFLGEHVGGALRMGAEPGFRDVSSVRGAVTRARWFERAALRDIVAYPEALRDRLWTDLARPRPDYFLGTARIR